MRVLYEDLLPGDCFIIDRPFDIRVPRQLYSAFVLSTYRGDIKRYIIVMKCRGTETCIVRIDIDDRQRTVKLINS